MSNMRSLYYQIQGLSQQAANDSGTSYEEYIRLFTLYFERSFKKRPIEAVKIANHFGYDELSHS